MDGRKLKVLIADDDFRIGKLISALIKWDELNLECVAVVNNGKDAFQIINDHELDIVITDIQMPLMNGLDLIAQTKEKAKNTKFIVISGYKDFEYAHRALQYDVTSYLLKPIDGDELNDTLKKLCDEFIEQSLRKSKEETLKKVVVASEQIIKRDILSDMLDNGSVPSVESVLKEYNIALKATAYTGVDIKLDYADFDEISKKRDQITVEKVINIFDGVFKDVAQEILICEKPYLHIYGLLIYDAQKSKEIKDKINGLLTEIQHYLIGFEQYKVTIGIGREVETLEKAFLTLEDASKAVYNRLKMGTGRLIYAKKLNIKPSGLMDIASEYKGEYLSAVNNYSIDMLENSIDGIFGRMADLEDIDCTDCYIVSRQLVKWFFAQESFQSEEQKSGGEILEFIEHCHTLPVMRDMLKKKLAEQINSHMELFQMRSIKPIRLAKKYIAEHIGEKNALEEIAEYVKLNPVYFSSLFKKETGMNYSAYLVNARMEAAKNLLVSTNETVAAIADQVGYKDVRYFSKLFAKTVGVKPAIYRKLYS